MTDSLTCLKNLSKRSPLIQRQDALAAGVNSSALTSLTRKGMLIRVGHGLYQLADDEAPNPELVEVSMRQPKGVIVLMSALVFHGIGSHRASEVWLQLPNNSPTPAFQWPRVRIVRSRLAEAECRLHPR